MDVTEIGNRIKKRRTALGMTQKDLAKEMSVSNQLISKWETGESVPSLEYLDALCKALKVDYSYFTSDSETEAEQPAAVQPVKAEKHKKFKWNWKLFIIITASVLAAAFIAGFSCLTVYVFVPAASRTRYIDEIEKAYENYFDLGYYSIIEKTELDGDVEDDYRYDGYFDANGKPVFYDTKSKNTVKDDILTHDGGTNKYHYVHDKTYETVEELAISKISPDEDELGLWDDEILNKISYIRKVKGGYYLEFKDEYFTDELSGTQKKNFKLTEKIKGRIDIKNGLYSYMEVTVKYLNRPDNEHFTIKGSFEFIAEKPVIEHTNLEEREWNGTYVGDKWYSPSSTPDNPDIPVIDDTPKCEELLSAEEFVSRLSGGKAQKLDNENGFNERVLNGQVKYGEGYYYFDNGKLHILNGDKLFESETVDLTEYGEISDVHAHFGDFYWTEFKNYTFTIYRYSQFDKKKTTVFDFMTNKDLTVTFNGRYALILEEYFASSTYYVISLYMNTAVNVIKDVANPYMDSFGNVYGEEKIENDFVPVIYKLNSFTGDNSGYTVLKGDDFFRVGGNVYTENDYVYIFDNNYVYKYYSGELRDRFSPSDPRFKENYVKLSNGYCITGTTSANIFDENGKERNFETFKLKDENGEWQTVHDYSSKEIIAVVNGKLIVSTDYFGGYLAVYDETDLTKPLYYMKKPSDYNGYCEFDELEVLNIGSKTIIAVRINTVDYYGYELYYF